MEILRLVTVHPLLVHLTLGSIPLVLLAYAVAAARRSAAWTLAGDLCLGFAAVVTLATFSFGLVSNAILDWPGGLGFWRWMHLGFGAATTAVLVTAAVARFVRRARGGSVSGLPVLAASGVVALLAAFTGWIGGEVLVYRGGMAVAAAGSGSLAPPVPPLRGATPKDIMEAMALLRGHWSAATTKISAMIVHHPTPDRFQALAHDARRLEELARWVETHGPEEMHEHGQSSPEAPGALAPSQQMATMAQKLGQRSGELELAARNQDLTGVVTALGSVSESCSGCHEALRWKKGKGAGEEAPGPPQASR